MKSTIEVAPHCANSRGLTPKELASMRRNYIQGTLAERVWPKIDVRGPDECWMWLAALYGNGYGKTTLDGRKSLGAHCAAWILANNQPTVPSGMQVCHTCDGRYPPGDITYRRCCNPAHLMLGDGVENMRQMIERGRSPFGDRHYMKTRRWSKFSLDQALVIRARLREGASLKQLGREYGVSHWTIKRVVYRDDSVYA